VLGAGRVGLVSAVLWAQSMKFVSIYEKDERKREAIASGEVPFHERGFNRLLSKVIQAERLRVVTDPESAVAVSDFCFVTTETPVRRDGSVNLSRVLSACAMVARGIAKSSHYHVVVIRSTVSPGTTSDLVRKTLERASGKRAGQDFGLAVYPEFLREGSAIQDMIHPDRVVLGVLDDRSGNALEAFVRGLLFCHD
jgi:UDPglucose 6-dehydrogenase